MIYCYQCPACHKKVEVSKPMAEMQRPELCPVCASVMQRDYRTEHGGKRRNVTWPMASVAAGVSADEVPEFIEHDRQHGVPTDYTSDGDPIFTGPQHRKRYCELHGLYDRNAGFSDPTPARR